MSENHNKIKIVGILLLLLAVFELPYGYYQFLRNAISILMIYLIYKSYEKAKTFWIVCFSAVLLVFNPIIPLYLDKELWILIDIGTAILLSVSIISNCDRKKENQKKRMKPVEQDSINEAAAEIALSFINSMTSILDMRFPNASRDYPYIMSDAVALEYNIYGTFLSCLALTMNNADEYRMNFFKRMIIQFDVIYDFDKNPEVSNIFDRRIADYMRITVEGTDLPLLSEGFQKFVLYSSKTTLNLNTAIEEIPNFDWNPEEERNIRIFMDTWLAVIRISIPESLKKHGVIL